jgi:hypothetical protein
MIRPVQRASLLLILVAVVATVLPSRAFRHPEHSSLPDFDKRSSVTPAAASAKGREADELGRRVRGAKVQLDPLTGTPRVVGSTETFLTGPRGEGRGVRGAAARFDRNDPQRPVKAFLHEHAALFGHGAEVLQRARLKREAVAPHTGMRTFVWQQELDGLPVFDALLVGHVTKDGELVSVSSRLLPEPEKAQGRNGARPLAARSAAALAARSLGEVVEEAGLSESVLEPGSERRTRITGAGLHGAAEARLTYLPMDRDTVRACWDVLVSRHEAGETYRVLLDADTGEVLLRHCLTAYLTEATYHVFTSDSPTPLSPGHALPSGDQPATVPRTLVTLSALNTNASPAGWIADGENETRGNNVDAHLDRNANDTNDEPRPQGSPFRVFDFPLDLEASPTNSQAAAVVQLFYWNNWIHDRLYELGFTEANGNFQTDNFGRGGLGNDAVQADAQDGFSFNNANFTTPPDGSAPRMQMFLWNGADPDRDSSFDAEIVIHEYVHGLSNRRVGGGALISALQTRGLGEGWSDFVALALLSEAEDDPAGNSAFGAYSARQFLGLEENYYYGIRRYPYSTNLAVHPLTLKDIDPAQAGAHPGVPRSPIIGNSANAVHNMGELWCGALWDARARLIAKHGFTNGNQLMLQLVVDGMGLAPANPTFLEARDAVIQADLVLTGGANSDDLWAAFARRGMGFSAFVPPAASTIGVIEAFDVPDDLRITPSTGLTSTGPVGGAFFPGAKAYVLTNLSATNLTWSAGTSADWVTLSETGGELGPNGAVTNLVVSLNASALALAAGVHTNLVTFTNQTSGRVQVRRFILGVGLPDRFTELFDALDNDLDYQTLVFTPDAGTNLYNVCRRVATVFPTDPAGGTVLSLTDDSSQVVNLTNGATVSIFGTNRSQFFIGSNGYLTFGSGDSEFFESLARHFDRLRVSGLFMDLDPSSGGTVSWKQLSNRVAVTWENVREWGSARQNSFQIEMFFDGTVAITHLELQSFRGLCGLSRGAGLPEAFVESDLSAYGICLPPMFLTTLSPVAENAGVVAGAGVVSLGAPLATNLSVMLYSADTNQLVVPLDVVLPAGTVSAPFALTLLDDALVNGPRAVSLMAVAPGFPSVLTNVLIADNDSPVASNLSFTIAGNAVTNLALTGLFPPSNTVTFQIVLPPARGLLAMDANTSGLFPYTPLWAFAGADQFTYTISDGAVTSAPAVVNITITPLADADSDGIADAWESGHGFAVGDALPNADEDGDGLSNLFEYLANTDPFDARSALQPPEVELMPGGVFRLKWKSIGGVRYRVQFSDGDADGNYNGSFTDLVRPLSVETDSSALGVESQMFFIDDFTISGGPPVSGRRYYRLRVGW